MGNDLGRRLYVIGTCGAAVALAALLFANAHPPALPVGDLIGLAAFGLLVVASELLATSFAVGPNRKVDSSVAFLPLFACSLFFSPFWVVVVAATAHAVVQPIRRVPAWGAVFNVSQYVISYGLAAVAYGLMGGKPGRPLDIAFWAFLALAIVFFVANILFISVYLTVAGRGKLSDTIRQTIGPSAGNLFYDLLASPLALFAAILFDWFGSGGLLLMTMPVYLLRYTYNSKQQLEKQYKDLLRVLVKAIETRDPYTSGHSLRVAVLARTIAQLLNLSRRVVERIETAALLHDIGKIEALYAPVISKPYTLSTEERALIRTHPTKGAEILVELSAFSADIVDSVHYHHERYDGSGYPSGLAGDKIPLASRIIMICDSVDAMLSDRPYRRALTVEAVEEELRVCAGSQFDPEIVRIVLEKDAVRGFARRHQDGQLVALQAVAGT